MPNAEEFTLYGRLTTLPTLSLVPTCIPTTINGVSTSTLAYIILGQSVATLGKIVIFHGQSTDLKIPEAVFAQVQTTVNGVPTTTPVSCVHYQRLVNSLDWKGSRSGRDPGCACCSGLVLTLIMTTIDGVAESRLVYVFSKSSIKSINETVAFTGKNTGLSGHTGAPVMYGGAMDDWSVSWSASLIRLSAVFVALL